LSADRPQLARRAIYDSLLWVVLALLLVGVWTFDRAQWPSLIGDEATYLMAAESLAWDFDLRYEPRDYERFVEHWRLPPEGLILQSGDGGATITFGKPFFYPLWAAPFSRMSPAKGPFIANFVILLIAAVLATRTLRQTVGAPAPVWVAAFVFASVTFAYTFWAHADLFLLSLTATALSLAFWRSDRAASGRWALVGALVAIVVFSRPLYLPLVLPVVLALPPRRRWRAAATLALGALGLTLAAAIVHRLHGDAWTSYGAQRRGFYSSTGFPGVDMPVESWQQNLDDLGDASWAEARQLTRLPPTAASLWFWNSIYFVVGRFIGVLPYFLPLVLGLLGRPRGAARWTLLAAVGLSMAGFFLYRPFNIYGGGGAIANRYFMPLFPAFWFLATRPLRGRTIAAVCLLAAPFLWPLWSDARSHPQRANHTYRYVSAVAQRLLPYETTQSHLKPGGRADVVHGGLWIKFLQPSLRQKRDGSALLLNRGARGQLLLGANEPVEEVIVQTVGDPQETLRVVAGAEVLEDSPNPRGRRLHLRLERRRARHPMWWTWDPFYLYQLTFQSTSEADGRLTFRVRRLPSRAEGGS
jgi:hypothetical protein